MGTGVLDSANIHLMDQKRMLCRCSSIVSHESPHILYLAWILTASLAMITE